MSAPHYHSGLDSDSKLAVELSIRELAEKIVAMRYGVHRLLSHLVDVRREVLESRIETYRRKGDDDVAATVATIGDSLMEGVLKLLNEGHY